MKILVTAFEPFGGSARNSSLDTLRSLPDFIGGAEIVKAVLPVEYVGAARALEAKLGEETDLSAVLCDKVLYGFFVRIISAGSVLFCIPACEYTADAFIFVDEQILFLIIDHILIFHLT